MFSVGCSSATSSGTGEADETSAAPRGSDVIKNIGFVYVNQGKTTTQVGLPDKLARIRTALKLDVAVEPTTKNACDSDNSVEIYDTKGASEGSILLCNGGQPILSFRLDRKNYVMDVDAAAIKAVASEPMVFGDLAWNVTKAYVEVSGNDENIDLQGAIDAVELTQTILPTPPAVDPDAVPRLQSVNYGVAGAGLVTVEYDPEATEDATEDATGRVTAKVSMLNTSRNASEGSRFTGAVAIDATAIKTLQQ
jgi:hypothetical protein